MIKLLITNYIFKLYYYPFIFFKTRYKAAYCGDIGYDKMAAHSVNMTKLCRLCGQQID